MRLADGHDATTDAWQLLKRRIRQIQFVASPTVLDELGRLMETHLVPDVRTSARRALEGLRHRWQFQPMDFNAVDEAIAANAIRRLRQAELIPYAERNDAAILVEAAVMDCVLLVSRDSHLLDVDREKLALLFRQLDLPTPVIASPENLLRKFCT
jgi:hypothetical protein